MKAPFLRTPYNYDTNKAGDESGLDTGTEGGAKQSFKEECDINVILKRFGIGYEIPPGVRIPTSGDFTGVNDFHSAMTQIRQAQEAFDLLPAHIRAKFNNDAGNFHDYAVDPKNLEGMADLGLLNERGLERARIARDERTAKEDGEAAARHEKRTKGAQQGSAASPTTQKD